MSTVTKKKVRLIDWACPKCGFFTRQPSTVKEVWHPCKVPPVQYRQLGLFDPDQEEQ